MKLVFVKCMLETKIDDATETSKPTLNQNQTYFESKLNQNQN